MNLWESFDLDLLMLPTRRRESFSATNLKEPSYLVSTFFAILLAQR